MSSFTSDPDREAIKTCWVKGTECFFANPETHLDGLYNIVSLFEWTGAGSGTTAEAIAQLTALGYGDLIDQVKSLMDRLGTTPTEDDLVQYISPNLIPRLQPTN